MTVVGFFSAKGAPGTTTTAMLAASLWPNPVLLADCDPAGGDVGLRLPAPDGRPLDLERGMLSLLSVARRSLAPDALAAHVQPVLGGGAVLVGLSGPEQAGAAGPAWATIAGVLGSLSGQDAILDLGRLDSRSPVLPLAVTAPLLVCVVDTSLPSVYAARARLRTLTTTLRDRDGGGPRIGLICRAADRREADGVAGVIRGEFSDVTYLGQLAVDERGAEIFNGRPVSRPERTLLVRSGREVVQAILDELSRLRISQTQVPDQPWNSLTGAYAAYAPYLAQPGQAGQPAQPLGAPPAVPPPSGPPPDTAPRTRRERRERERREGR